MDWGSFQKRKCFLQLHCWIGQETQRIDHEGKNMEVELLPRIYKNRPRFYGGNEKEKNPRLSTSDDQNFIRTSCQLRTD